MKDRGGNTNQLDLPGILTSAIFLGMCVGHAGRGTRLLGHQAHFADELTARTVGQDTIRSDPPAIRTDDAGIDRLDEKSMEPAQVRLRPILAFFLGKTTGPLDENRRGEQSLKFLGVGERSLLITSFKA